MHILVGIWEEIPKFFLEIENYLREINSSVLRDLFSCHSA